MSFDQVLNAFKSGKKIKRKDNHGVHESSSSSRYFITYNDLLSDDWEIVEEESNDQGI